MKQYTWTVTMQCNCSCIHDIPPTLGLLYSPIWELEIDNRYKNVIASYGLKRVIDIVTIELEDILKIPGFGRKGLNQLVAELARHGYSLGMSLEERKDEQ